MRSVRTKGRRVGKRRPVPKIDTSVLFTGKRPIEYRGAYTGLLYIWPASRPATWGVWMDHRDVPGLIKKAGIENLAGKYIDELTEKMAALEKKKTAKRKAKEKAKEKTKPEVKQEAPDEL